MYRLLSQCRPRTAVKRLQTLALRIVSAAQASRRDERGQSLVEYALIIALISLVIVAVYTPLRAALTDVFQRITDALTTQ